MADRALQAFRPGSPRVFGTKGTVLLPCRRKKPDFFGPSGTPDARQKEKVYKDPYQPSPSSASSAPRSRLQDTKPQSWSEKGGPDPCPSPVVQLIEPVKRVKKPSEDLSLPSTPNPSLESPFHHLFFLSGLLYFNHRLRSPFPLDSLRTTLGPRVASSRPVDYAHSGIYSGVIYDIYIYVPL